MTCLLTEYVRQVQTGAGETSGSDGHVQGDPRLQAAHDEPEESPQGHVRTNQSVRLWTRPPVAQ